MASTGIEPHPSTPYVCRCRVEGGGSGPAVEGDKSWFRIRITHLPTRNGEYSLRCRLIQLLALLRTNSGDALLPSHLDFRRHVYAREHIL